MIFAVLSINWTGQALTPAQLLVLRNVAAKHLREGHRDSVFNFSHSLCEGQITRGKEGAFGTFGGTFFHADLGVIKGERWTADFLLPRGSERVTIGDNDAVISARMTPGGRFDKDVVDHHAASAEGSRVLH